MTGLLYLMGLVLIFSLLLLSVPTIFTIIVLVGRMTKKCSKKEAKLMIEAIWS